VTTLRALGCGVNLKPEDQAGRTQQVAAWQDLGECEQLVAQAAFTITGLVRAGHAAADREKKNNSYNDTQTKLLAEKNIAYSKLLGCVWAAE
jgi:hypothetical protein